MMRTAQSLICFGVSAIAWLPTSGGAQGLRPGGRPDAPMIADYNAELRGTDSHVDIPLMIRQLRALGVNCYFWLIWHAETDWEDLHRFLPEARKAGIDVWVYLVPPSEPPPSQPFGLDFVRWGQEIAKLSLKYSNLRGWIIDDFYANSAKLTPEYIARMQRAAKAINPNLLFYPLMYYREIHYPFVEAYAAVIDGVVVAYPTDRDQLRRAARILRDEIPLPPRCEMTYPWETPSRAGDMVQISRKMSVVEGADRYLLRFSERDTFTGPTAGYHFLQVLVDGQIVWEQDVAGGDLEWHLVRMDLAKAVRGKREITLAIRCYDKKGVSNFGVQVEWSKLAAEGLQPASPSLGDKDAWQLETKGRWSCEFHPRAGGTGRFRLPYIVMPAGSPSAFRKRHPGSKGTPEEVAAHVNMILRAIEAGDCDGIAIYCLPKQPGNPYFEAVKKVIAEAKPKLLRRVR